MYLRMPRSGREIAIRGRGTSSSEGKKDTDEFLAENLSRRPVSPAHSDCRTGKRGMGLLKKGKTVTQENWKGGGGSYSSPLDRYIIRRSK